MNVLLTTKFTHHVGFLSIGLMAFMMIIQSCQSSDDVTQQDIVTQDDIPDLSSLVETIPAVGDGQIEWGEDVYKVVDELSMIESCRSKSDDPEIQYDCSNRELLSYLYSTLRYPEEAIAAKIEGRVYIQFIITEEGKIGKTKLIKDIGGGCGTAALASIQKMAEDDIRWTPGVKDGQAVKVLHTLPVTFKMES